MAYIVSIDLLIEADNEAAAFETVITNMEQWLDAVKYRTGIRDWVWLEGQQGSSIVQCDPVPSDFTPGNPWPA